MACVEFDTCNSNFNGVASQMNCLWTEPLLVGVCSRENYSIGKTKMVLSITTFLCLLWMTLKLHSSVRCGFENTAFILDCGYIQAVLIGSLLLIGPSITFHFFSVFSVIFKHEER